MILLPISLVAAFVLKQSVQIQNNAYIITKYRKLVLYSISAKRTNINYTNLLCISIYTGKIC